MTILTPSSSDQFNSAAEAGRFELPLPHVGVISNPKSYRNRREGFRPLDLPNALVIRHAPHTPEDLARTMAQFARTGVELIVIDGGDGTVREVMGAAVRAYPGKLPRFAILPSGKTNALAADLQVPTSWSLRDVVNAHLENRVSRRRAIMVQWANGSRPEQYGFLFGFGAFVRATVLARRVHRHGWFGNAAIVATLAWALAQTFLGGPRSKWTRGESVRMSGDSAEIGFETVYLLLGSTLRQMPLGLRPFGPPRDGLKFLVVKAPPRGLLRFLPHILSGTGSEVLAEHGYVRRDEEKMFLAIRKGFILDGERYPGGNLMLSSGPSITFVVP